MTDAATLDSTTLRDLVVRLGAPSRLTPFVPTSPLFSATTVAGSAPMSDPDGVLAMLRTAHRALSLVQIDVVLPGEAFDRLICFGPGGESVLLSPGSDGITVRSPAPMEELVDGVAQYFGSSVLRAVPFRATVDARAAWMLVAAVDLERRRMLMTLTGTAEPGPAAFDATTLVGALRRSSPDFQSLTSVVAAAAGKPPEPDASSADWAMDNLCRTGLFAGSAAGYTLAGDALAFARRFLLPQVMLRVQVARETAQGELEKSALWFVQAGIHDVLMVEVAEGALMLEALSAAAVLEIVRQAITEADLHGSPGCATHGKHGTELMRAVPQR